MTRDQHFGPPPAATQLTAADDSEGRVPRPPNGTGAAFEDAHSDSVVPAAAAVSADPEDPGRRGNGRLRWWRCGPVGHPAVRQHPVVRQSVAGDHLHRRPEPGQRPQRQRHPTLRPGPAGSQATEELAAAAHQSNCGQLLPRNCHDFVITMLFMPTMAIEIFGAKSMLFL